MRASGQAWSVSAALILAVSGSARAQESKPTRAASEGVKAATAPSRSAAPASSLLDAIIAPDAKPIVIVTGLKFSEGPVWVPKFGSGTDAGGGFLLFSDIPANKVLKWTPPASGDAGVLTLAEATPEIFLENSDFANGLTIAPDQLPGREPLPKSADGKERPAYWLFLAQHAGKVSTMRITGGAMTLLAQKFEDKGLSSPNDVVVKSNGAVYFTDPPYGVRGSLGPGGRKKELDFSGIFRFDPKGGVALLDKGMPTPNGLAFSPDEKTLYVADTSKGEIRAFGVQDDGTLDEGRLFAQLRFTNDKGEERSAGGDGVKVDVEGNVYCAARGGVFVFSPAGEKSGVIAIKGSVTNLCFGGPDRKTLFMTTPNAVYAVPVKIAGHSWMK